LPEIVSIHPYLSFDEFLSLKKVRKGVSDSIQPICRVSYEYARTYNFPATAVTVMTMMLTKTKMTMIRMVKNYFLEDQKYLNNNVKQIQKW